MPEVTFTRSNDYQATHLSRAQAPGWRTAQPRQNLRYTAPVLKSMVLENTLDKAVSTPTDKRGFVTPKFWGLVRPHRSPHSFGRDGPSRKAGRTALDVF